MTATRTHRGLALLVATLLTTTLAAPAATAGSAPAQVTAPVPALDWRPCGAGLEPFLCATAEVPRDYDHPRGPTTTIALTLLPASGDPAERIGTLFTNPGGPGAAASSSSRRALRRRTARRSSRASVRG